MRSLSFRLVSLGAALAIGATAIVAQAPTSDAQGRPRVAQRQPRQHADRGPGGQLFQDITLTDAQRTRVRTLHQQFAEQRRQLVGDRGQRRAQGADSAARRQRPDSATRAAFRAEREAMRTKLQQLTDRQTAELRAVLTPAQQPTFDRNVAALKQRMQERGPGRVGLGGRGFGRGPGRAGASDRHAGHGGR